jgi:hypothetical protein
MKEPGGVLFGSNAACPDCSPNLIKDAMRYGEEAFIKGQQAKGETFHAACMRWRGGNNTMTITSGNLFEDIFGEPDSDT